MIKLSIIITGDIAGITNTALEDDNVTGAELRELIRVAGLGFDKYTPLLDKIAGDFLTSHNLALPAKKKEH